MDNTITTRKAPTAEELQQLEADFLGYKRQVLEILGEESEIVKDITPRHMFFEQIKINIKAQRNNQWKQHEKLLNLLKQGDIVERELWKVRRDLLAVLASFDITKISSIQSAIESVQIGTIEVNPEGNKEANDKNKIPLEDLDIPVRLKNRITNIQDLLREEGKEMNTCGDLLKFREEKGGRRGVRKRMEKNLSGLGAKSVTEIECFIKKKEMKSDKEKKHTDELTYTEVFGERKSKKLESLQDAAKREGKNLRTHDDLIHLWKEKGGQYGMIRRINGIDGVGPMAAVYIEAFLKGKGYI